jgi:hypothetical protein
MYPFAFALVTIFLTSAWLMSSIPPAASGRSFSVSVCSSSFGDISYLSSLAADCRWRDCALPKADSIDLSSSCEPSNSNERSRHGDLSLPVIR